MLPINGSGTLKVPMDDDELADLVTRYLKYGRTEAEELHPAFSRVVDIVEDSAQDGWRVTRALIDRAPDQAALAYVAAGPLEDLLACHGPETIDEVLEAARTDAKLRSAVTRGVWGRNRIRADVQAKLRAFANMPRA